MNGMEIAGTAQLGKGKKNEIIVKVLVHTECLVRLCELAKIFLMFPQSPQVHRQATWPEKNTKFLKDVLVQIGPEQSLASRLKCIKEKDFPSFLAEHRLAGKKKKK